MCWHQPWYGSMFTCLRCGERWVDGEMLERPFAPRWRKDNIKCAEKFYRKWKPRLMKGGK